MGHKLAAGVVIIKGERLLLVKDKTGWSLPKGSTETGETFGQTARREAFEETGYRVKMGEVAFVTEVTSPARGQYLQVYYAAELDEQVPRVETQDDDVLETEFVPLDDIRRYIKFRAWLIPLENWIRDRTARYYTFDLEKETAYLD